MEDGWQRALHGNALSLNPAPAVLPNAFASISSSTVGAPAHSLPCKDVLNPLLLMVRVHPLEPWASGPKFRGVWIK